MTQGVDLKMKLAWVVDWLESLGRGMGSVVTTVSSDNEKQAA